MRTTRRSTALLAALAGITLVAAQTEKIVTGSRGNASVITNNTPGVLYMATLPNSVTTDVRGAVVVASNPSSTGVNFQVSMAGFPDEGGPFSMSSTVICPYAS